MDWRAESLRKTIHAGLAILPFLAWLASARFPAAVRICLMAAGLSALAVDLIRLRQSGFGRWIRQLAGPLMRPGEARWLTGATTWFLALGLTFLFFDRSVALSAMLFFVTGDAAAAVLGQRLGGPMIRPGRSVAGTTAFLLFALATLPLLRWLDPRLTLPVLLAGAAAAAAGELVSSGRVDNLVAPLASGGAMTVVLRSF